MSTPNKGDLVHVAFGATYHDLVDGRHVVKIPSQCGSVHVALPADAEVEILRPPVKVWDVIETAEQLDALPLGAVVHCKRQCAAERYAGGWYETADETGTFNAELLPATVLYLPDGAA